MRTTRTTTIPAAIIAALALLLLASPGVTQAPARVFGTDTSGNPVAIGATSGALNVFLNSAVRTLTTNTTSANSPADTNENTLWTWDLPAGTLSTNGRGVRVKVWGSFAANANNKTPTLYFGAAVIALRGASGYTTCDFEMNAVVIRTGATTQVSMGTIMIGTTHYQAFAASPTETLANAIAIKFTGKSGTGTAADIVFKGAIVEAM